MKHTTALAAFIIACAAFTLLASVAVDASVTVPYQMYEAHFDAAGNFIPSQTPVDNVNVIGFVCADHGCNHVSDPLWNGQTLSTGSTNQITLTYPTQLQSQFGYAVFYYKDGYIAWEQNPSWSGNGDVSTPSSKYLTKVQDCKAPIDTFSVINDVYPNEPIMVDISASLDATTRNSFEQGGLIGYVPDVIRQQNQLQIQVTLDIMDSQGHVVNTQNKVVVLDPQGSQRVQFDYTPTIVDRYTARVSTKVTDNKCTSTDEQFSQKSFNVISRNPTNQCYTLLNNLNVQPINQVANNPVTITFDKISNYYDGSGNLFPLATHANITIQKDGQIIRAQQLDLPANANAVDPFPTNVQFTPATSGTYTVSVSGAVAVCPFNANTADAVSQDFTIVGPNLKNNTAPLFTRLPDVRLFYNQGTVNNLFNINNFVIDPDQDPMTFAITSQNAPNILTCALAQNGEVSCTTKQDQVGCSVIGVSASDGKLTSNANFQACILAPNQAPVFRQLPDATLPKPSGEANKHVVNLNDYAFDPDGQTLTYTIVTQTNPTVVNCVIVGAYLSCTGDLAQSGVSQIRVVASDGALSASSAFTITVNPGTNNTGLDLLALPTIHLQPNSGLNQNVLDLKQYTRNPQNRPLTYTILGETNIAAVDCALTIAHTLNCDAKPNVFNQASDVTIAVTDGINQVSQTTHVIIGSGALAGCTGPGNIVIASGSSQLYYQTSSVSSGQTCASEQRTCTNGVLSGSYQFASCTTAASSCVGPNNMTIASGDTMTFYQAPFVVTGTSCVSQQRSCNNGVLSGSYQYSTCAPVNNTPPVCTQIPQLSMLRNSQNTLFDLNQYVYDPDVQHSNQSLNFRFDISQGNFENQTGFAFCSLTLEGTLFCKPNHGQDATAHLFINVTDGFNSTICPVDVTVGIDKKSSRQKTNDGLLIMQFIVPDLTAGDLATGTIPVTVSLRNDGRSLDDVVVTATIMELGTSTSEGPMNLGSQAKNVALYLPVDRDIAPGTYTVQLTVSDKSNGLNRIAYRDLVVYG